jgi:hypothetical protein
VSPLMDLADVEREGWVLEELTGSVKGCGVVEVVF